MLTFTHWPRSIVRIGLAMLLTGLLTLGLLTLGASGVAATSLVTTTAPAENTVAPDSELLRVVLETADGTMTSDHMLFIEQNVLLPDYYVGALSQDDDIVVDSPAAPALTHDEIQFRNDNWMTSTATATPHQGRERVEVIDALRAQNLADFDAMEQAPGLYTDQ